MKRTLKAYRIPQPLVDALRVVAETNSLEQTEIVVDALASLLERRFADEDSRVASFLAEYREATQEK